MENYNLESHLEPIYATYPEARHRPVIGITANYSDSNAMLMDRYYKQVVAAGGVPMLLPPVSDSDVIINALDHIDGLLLTGGADINPLWAGEQPRPQLHGINAERDLPELLTTRLAYNRQIPLLGICRGIQTLALALGGKVEQDIYSAPSSTDEKGATTSARPLPPLLKHSQDAARDVASHTVELLPGSILAHLYGFDSDGQEQEKPAVKPILYVNSFHHQAVADPGKHFRVTATAPDGIIEAMESSEHRPLLGVQWHPEWLGADGLPIFRWLVSEASLFAKAKAVSRRVLTLDTHCDTPMFFPQGVGFGRRDPRILYDLEKMTEGRQDAVTMVAYLPQPKAGQTLADCIDLDGIARHNPALAARYIHADRITPNDYADLIFDKIGEILEANKAYIRQARTPEELWMNKHRGVHSLMIGIENGLALNHDLSLVKHFRDRGLVYITLCHNGDNDLCDSARGTHTHHGVSEFGAQVIREMNRQGVMVDLSHAAEESFYDALDISQVPIVCSHSNSRALCDVPRNLTDDQLRALAKHGGVAHVTLYHGFLRREGPASLLDVMAHLEHAIRIMGIDHVGIGTDFDGDGTVEGCRDASELINITTELLRRRYSETDIQKIWGGNWMRVMQQVQNQME